MVEIGQCSEVSTAGSIWQRGYRSGIVAAVVGWHVVVDDVKDEGCTYVESLSGDEELVSDVGSSHKDFGGIDRVL